MKVRIDGRCENTDRGSTRRKQGENERTYPPVLPKKKMPFDCTTDKDIAITMHRLNHRPRKCFGFKTPHEVFCGAATLASKRRCTSDLNPPYKLHTEVTPVTVD